jgi:hypothetical protein
MYFDYLLGIAALDSGKPDRATIAFERVLAVNPNFAGARLDLAIYVFAAIRGPQAPPVGFRKGEDGEAIGQIFFGPRS